MKKTFKAAVFDLDGTLINSLPDIAGSMNTVLRRHGYPEYSNEQHRLFIGNGIKRLVELCTPKQHATAEKTDELYRQMVEEYTEHCVDNTAVYDGIYGLLNALSRQGVKLAVLSNKADSITKKICGILFQSAGFDIILGATERFPKKPDPQSSLYIVEQLAVLPEEVFYLGDTRIDMETARAAGFFPAGAAWGFRGTDELIAANAKFIADKPEDCLQFF